MEGVTLDANGLILLSVGLLLRFLIGRRRFKRRNLAGLQVFSSYAASQIIPFIEWVLNLIGLLLIVFGIVTILVA